MKLPTPATFILLCFILPFSVFSQVAKDSLEVLLETGRDYYHKHDYAKSIEFNTLLIEEAAKIQDHYYAFREYDGLGNLYSWVLKDTLKGNYNGHKALEYALLSQEDSLIAWAYTSLGNKIGESGVHMEKAIPYYEKAIDIRKKQEGGDVKNIIEYMNIGWTYIDLGQPDKALPYLVSTRELTKVEKQARYWSSIWIFCLQGIIS